MAEFEQVKTGNYAISKKLRDAIPLRITGYRQTADLGVAFPKIIGDGLILAGTAANFMGTWPAIVTGGYAGEVAAEAVQEDDVTVKKLSKYEDLCKELRQAGRPFVKKEIYGVSDEAIEDVLSGMIERGEIR